MAQVDAYDPYASAAMPHTNPAPSGYTETYLAQGKVSLVTHPREAYERGRGGGVGGGYRGSNHRWTEERLFFRGYRVKAQEEREGGRGGEETKAELKDLLFDAPLYSSFAGDGVYREPQRKGRKKTVRLMKVVTPRMRRREEEGEEEKGGGGGS